MSPAPQRWPRTKPQGGDSRRPGAKDLLDSPEFECWLSPQSGNLRGEMGSFSPGGHARCVGGRCRGWRGIYSSALGAGDRLQTGTVRGHGSGTQPWGGKNEPHAWTCRRPSRTLSKRSWTFTQTQNHVRQSVPLKVRRALTFGGGGDWGGAWWRLWGAARLWLPGSSRFSGCVLFKL